MSSSDAAVIAPTSFDPLRLGRFALSSSWLAFCVFGTPETSRSKLNSGQMSRYCTNKLNVLQKVYDLRYIFLFSSQNSVIRGFIHATRAIHYRTSLRSGSIVKVSCFEVARCTNMYKITDNPFVIRFIPISLFLP